jgi:hypothetical protein
MCNRPEYSNDFAHIDKHVGNCLCGVLTCLQLEIMWIFIVCKQHDANWDLTCKQCMQYVLSIGIPNTLPINVGFWCNALQLHQKTRAHVQHTWTFQWLCSHWQTCRKLTLWSAYMSATQSMWVCMMCKQHDVNWHLTCTQCMQTCCIAAASKTCTCRLSHIQCISCTCFKTCSSFIMHTSTII